MLIFLETNLTVFVLIRSYTDRFEIFYWRCSVLFFYRNFLKVVLITVTVIL